MNCYTSTTFGHKEEILYFYAVILLRGPSFTSSTSVITRHCDYLDCFTNLNVCGCFYFSAC